MKYKICALIEFEIFEVQLSLLSQFTNWYNYLVHYVCTLYESTSVVNLLVDRVNLVGREKYVSCSNITINVITNIQ